MRGLWKLDLLRLPHGGSKFTTPKRVLQMIGLTGRVSQGNSAAYSRESSLAVDFLLDIPAASGIPGMFNRLGPVIQALREYPSNGLNFRYIRGSELKSRWSQTSSS